MTPQAMRLFPKTQAIIERHGNLQGTQGQNLLAASLEELAEGLAKEITETQLVRDNLRKELKDLQANVKSLHQMPS